MRRQSTLGCGRQCGSCQSEVNQCAAAHWAEALTYTDIYSDPDTEHEQTNPAKEDVA
ncbi:hypothetical protein ACRWQN_13750 [Shewanella sp. HL-SH8]|uniref:hypothetical protein n=1 Tax=Shewanella sp. HL-SH8 TaxID=3436242 RepID=UPI003EB6BDCC